MAAAAATAVVLLAKGFLEGLGAGLGQAVYGKIPSNVTAPAEDALASLIGNVAPVFRWQPAPAAPPQLLRGLVGGAAKESKEGWVFREIDGQLREIPLISQVGLDWMLRIEAGDTGNLRDAPVGMSIRRRRELQEKYILQYFDFIEGRGRLDERGLYRAMNYDGDVVEIDWRPSYREPTTHSALIIRKGRLVKGIPPKWRIVRTIPLSHRRIFSGLPSDYCFGPCG